MKNTNKHTIWTNRLDLEEYRNSMPPEEIAGLTDEELTSRMCEENELWLSDDKASGFVTGTVIPVDGSISALVQR